MTKLNKAKKLNELGIEYKVLQTGEMVCYVNGAWVNAGKYIESL